jgi:hypothetical protein
MPVGLQLGTPPRLRSPAVARDPGGGVPARDCRRPARAGAVPATPARDSRPARPLNKASRSAASRSPPNSPQGQHSTSEDEVAGPPPDPGMHLPALPERARPRAAAAERSIWPVSIDTGVELTSAQNGGFARVPLDLTVIQSHAAIDAARGRLSDRSGVPGLLEVGVGRWPGACNPASRATGWLHHASPCARSALRARIFVDQ